MNCSYNNNNANIDTRNKHLVSAQDPVETITEILKGKTHTQRQKSIHNPLTVWG